MCSRKNNLFIEKNASEKSSKTKKSASQKGKARPFLQNQNALDQTKRQAETALQKTLDSYVFVFSRSNCQEAVMIPGIPDIFTPSKPISYRIFWLLVKILKFKYWDF